MCRTLSTWLRASLPSIGRLDSLYSPVDAMRNMASIRFATPMPSVSSSVFGERECVRAVSYTRPAATASASSSRSTRSCARSNPNCRQSSSPIISVAARTFSRSLSSRPSFQAFTSTRPAPCCGRSSLICTIEEDFSRQGLRARPNRFNISKRGGFFSPDLASRPVRH